MDHAALPSTAVSCTHTVDLSSLHGHGCKLPVVMIRLMADVLAMGLSVEASMIVFIALCLLVVVGDAVLAGRGNAE